MDWRPANCERLPKKKEHALPVNLETHPGSSQADGPWVVAVTPETKVTGVHP